MNYLRSLFNGFSLQPYYAFSEEDYKYYGFEKDLQNLSEDNKTICLIFNSKVGKYVTAQTN